MKEVEKSQNMSRKVISIVIYHYQLIPGKLLPSCQLTVEMLCDSLDMFVLFSIHPTSFRLPLAIFW
jgi:hypothetical protein